MSGDFGGTGRESSSGPHNCGNVTSGGGSGGFLWLINKVTS